MQTVNYNKHGQVVATRKASKGTGFTMAKASLLMVGLAIVAVSMILANIF